MFGRSCVACSIRKTVWDKSGAGPGRRAMWASLAAVVAAVGLTAVAREARAVVLYSSPKSNILPPSAAQGLDAWNLEGTFGCYLATPIDSTHFVAASHVGVFPSITFHGTTYQVDPSFHGGEGYAADPGSDLRIYQITTSATGPFPTWAPLYNAAVDGSEIGKTLTVFGKGVDRGAAVTLDGVLKGWHWGPGSSGISWGQNIVSRFDRFNGVSSSSLLAFDFDADGLPDEGALSDGDSSGGVFILSNGQWKLDGVNYAIDSPFSLTGDRADSGFVADVFDARGLYATNSSNNWSLVQDQGVVVPGASYASRISDRLGWMQSVDPQLTALAPEPASLVLLAAPLALFFWRWRIARRAT
jgi:hypothetical protein